MAKQSAKRSRQYHVYVIELHGKRFRKKLEEGGAKKFREHNPHIWGPSGLGITKKTRFYYVGQSAHEPKCRFRQHKRCHGQKILFECKCSCGPLTIVKNRSNAYVREFGTMLRKWKYNEYNPIQSRDEALKKEKEIAKDIRLEGHAAYFA